MSNARNFTDLINAKLNGIIMSLTLIKGYPDL